MPVQKTTILVDQDALRGAKAKAALKGLSLSEVIESKLKEFLVEDDRTPSACSTSSKGHAGEHP